MQFKMDSMAKDLLDFAVGISKSMICLKAQYWGGQIAQSIDLDFTKAEFDRMVVSVNCAVEQYVADRSMTRDMLRRMLGVKALSKAEYKLFIELALFGAKVLFFADGKCLQGKDAIDSAEALKEKGFLEEIYGGAMIDGIDRYRTFELTEKATCLMK